MNFNNSIIQSVPTNIITGFLGVGKTSAILHLLKSKPQQERWAVLVNEFGEIGVDGALFEGQYAQKQGVYIKEVPGGCMCCTAGLPMQVALNQLLTQSNPDRLLIEPTGLGHPKEVLQVLSAAHYESILMIQKTITLVDARQLSDLRYSDHDTYKQQIAIADTVVANKQDLYLGDEIEQLKHYLSKHGKPMANLILTEHGQIPLSALEGEINDVTQASTCSHHHGKEHAHEHHDDNHNHHEPLAAHATLPDSGYIKATNQGEGFQSMGWRFSPEKIFNRSALSSLLRGLSVERMKAVFITESGVFGYNLTPDALMEMELDDCFESHIEIIADQISDDIETQLFDCIVPA